MANKTKWEITGEIKPIGWLEHPITNYEILDNGFLRITQYWQDPDNNDVYANGTIESIEIPPCDLNSDGIVNIVDIISLVNIVLNQESLDDFQSCAGDLSGDGVINIVDIISLVNVILSE
mgnify:CR=1 FL=1